MFKSQSPAVHRIKEYENMKTHFLIILLCVFFVPVHGAIIHGAIFHNNMTPGQEITDTIGVNITNVSEIGTPLTVTLDNGNASQWITLSTPRIVLADGTQDFTASVEIPAGGVHNGYYVSHVLMTAPSTGMLQMQLEVPVEVRISGGLPAFTPTPTPIPTAVQTAAQTGTISPGATISPAITQSTVPMQETTTQPAGQPGPDMGTGIMVLAGIFVVVFAGVMIHDYKRGKK